MTSIPSAQQLALSFMIMVGGSGFVLGPSLPATWLPATGSFATIELHEGVVDAVVGLHEVMVVTTDNSRLP